MSAPARNNPMSLHGQIIGQFPARRPVFPMPGQNMTCFPARGSLSAPARTAGKERERKVGDSAPFGRAIPQSPRAKQTMSRLRLFLRSHRTARKQAFSSSATTQKRRISAAPLVYFALRGGRGIRTPGTLPYNSFQDCRHRPLGHSSILNAMQRFRLQGVPAANLSQTGLQRYGFSFILTNGRKKLHLYDILTPTK